MGRLKLALILAALGYGAYKFKTQDEVGSIGSSLVYQDMTGRASNLVNNRSAQLFVMWIEQCGYSARALKLADKMRQIFPADQLDIVGFYLNRTDDGHLRDLASSEKHSVRFAAAQQRIELMQQLIDRFKFGNPGREAFLVDKDGNIFRVDLSGDDSFNTLADTLGATIREHLP